VSAIHLLGRLSRCHSAKNPQSLPDLNEILAAISERQQILERQWESILQSLPEASPAEITGRLLALDEERLRYRRFWRLLRANLRAAQREALTWSESDAPRAKQDDADLRTPGDFVDNRPHAR